MLIIKVSEDVFYVVNKGDIDRPCYVASSYEEAKDFISEIRMDEEDEQIDNYTFLAIRKGNARLSKKERRYV